MSSFRTATVPIAFAINQSTFTHSVTLLTFYIEYEITPSVGKIFQTRAVFIKLIKFAIGILEHRDQQLIFAIYIRKVTAKIVSKVVRSFEIFHLKVKRILVIIKRFLTVICSKKLEFLFR